MSNVPKGKILGCSVCGAPVSVGEEAVSVKCGECVVGENFKLFPELINKLNKRAEENKNKTDFKKPRGWHWMETYVDPEGNVFHKGVESVEEKGKLKPTVIEIKDKRSRVDKKIEQRELDRLRRESLIEVGTIKKQIIKLANAKDRAQSKSEEGALSRKIKKEESNLRKAKKTLKKYL